MIDVSEMRGVRRPALLLLALLLGGAAPVAAQFTQYSAPGELAIPEPPSREGFERAMANARWRLGPLRLDPSIWLSDLRWVEDPGRVTGVGSDITATVGAGLHAYTRIGPDVVVAARALPEYVWWKELDQLNTVNGRYGVGVFGFFSRLRFGVSAGSDRRADYLSSEVDRLVNSRDDSGEAGFEIDLPGRMALFGAVSAHQFRYDDEDIFGLALAPLLFLERDKSRVRAGVKVAVTPHLRVGIGAEASETDFVRPERDRSSSGSGPLLELALDGARLKGQLLVLWPGLDPEPGSSFLPFDEPLGFARLTWKPRGALEWQLYASSDLVYSVRSEYPYYRGDRVGLAARWPLGWRVTTGLFVEAGNDDYAVPPGEASFSEGRTSYGATLGVDLGRQTRLQVRVTEIDYDRGGRSNLRVEAGISVGSGRGGWY